MTEHMPKQHLSYAQKMAGATKEAQAAGKGLLLIVIIWIVLGFGLAPITITFFGIPLWVWTGCIGTWICSIAWAVYMARHVIDDVSLDDNENDTSHTHDAK